MIVLEGILFPFGSKRYDTGVWIGKGAKPSSTLARILKGRGMKNMEPYIQDMADRKRKKT